MVVRYAINGLVATAVHFLALTFNLRVLGMESAGLANLLAAVVGISSSFLGNRYFVFDAGSQPWGKQLLSFSGLYTLLAVAHGVILYIWTDVGGLDYRAGFVLATVFQTVTSYIGNKVLVFRK